MLDHAIESAASAKDHDPFALGTLVRSHPTIDAQREIWLAMRLSPDAAAAYNDTLSLTLDGPLDRMALEGALQGVVVRHDALRATITGDGELLLVWKTGDLPLDEVDLSRLSPDQQTARLFDLEDDHVRRVPTLSRASGLRVTLAKCHPTRHVLILTVSHILCDGLSWAVLLSDLAALYAHLRGRGPAPDPAPSFVDYMALAIAEEGEEALAPHLDHWRVVLADGGPEWSLPLDRPVPTERGFACGRVDKLVPRDLVDRLKGAARANGLTFHSFMLTAFATYLHRLSGADDLIVGVPAAGQAAHGFEGMVGHAVHLLPIRSRLVPDLPFTEAARSLRGALLEAMDHQAVDFGTLLRYLPIKRTPGRVPLMPVIFNIDQGDDIFALDGLETTPRSVPRVFDGFEIFLDSVDRAEGLELQWYHAQWLFDEATIARHADGFLALLWAIGEAPATPVDALPLMDGTERTRWVEDWNGGHLDLPGDAGPLGLIAAQVARRGSAEAVLDRDGALTYDGLWRWAGALATALRVAGLETGQVVGVLCQRGRLLLPAMLAVWRAGGVYLPLDPEFPASRLEAITGDAGLAFLLHDGDTRPSFSIATEAMLRIEDHWKGETGDLPPQPGGQTRAYLMYTSGSTGMPKGVPISHWALANFLQGMDDRLDMTEASLMLAQTTVSFDISLLELLLPLVSGARVAIASQAMVRDPGTLAAFAQEQGVTHWQATPQSWRMLFAVGWTGDPELVCLSAGEALPRDVAQGLLSRCRTLWNVYGPTEATVYVTLARITDPDDITVGTPLPNCRVYVVDGRNRPLPPGVVGHLLIGGRCVTEGYLNRPDLNAEAFVPDAFTGMGQLYRSGDLALLTTDGRLRHLGRRDGQVKVRGYRIELEDIEAHLTRHPDLEEAAVVVAEAGESTARLVAAVVPRPGITVEPARLRTALLADLPNYMVPAEYVSRSRLPRTGSGKLDRKAVLASLEGPVKAGVPAGRSRSTPPSASDDIAPPGSRPELMRPGIEPEVLALWRDLLRRPDLGVDDRFFESGGHSLLAAQLMVRLNKMFDTRVTLGELLNHDTVRSLASLVAARRPTVGAHAVRLITGVPEVPPLYLMPPQGGQILRYGFLLEALDPRLPTWAFEQGATMVHLASVEEITQAFVDEIQRLQPHGPVRVGGFSFGGVLALEAAQRLTAEGRTVDWLVLLDALNWPRESIGFKLKRAVLEGWYRKDKWSWFRHKVTRNALKLVGRYTEPVLMELDLLDDPVYAKLHAVHDTALLDYTPAPYGGRVLKFRAVGDPIRLGLLPNGGWNDTFQGFVERVDIELSNHLEVLGPDTSQKMAKEINRWLLEDGGTEQTDVPTSSLPSFKQPMASGQ
jgi:amino acid adenylation domain-containing protein